jgi:hypothetical protein
MVFCAVSFIEMFQVGAREAFAFKTKLSFSRCKEFTFLYLTFYAGEWFVRVYPSAPWAFIPFSKISHADVAIHAAGSDRQKRI